MFDKNSALKLQQSLLNNGFDPKGIDGIWGTNSQKALDASFQKYDIAWSKSVPSEFVAKTKEICERLQIPDASFLMSAMAFETGRTFSPTIQAGTLGKKNVLPPLDPNYPPYVGLMQFGPMALKDINVKLADLVKMSALEQLDCVYKWFLPYKGKLKDLPSLYVRNLWPSAVAKPDSYVLWDKSTRPTTYIQNKGLDLNKDGLITRGEVSKTIYNMYAEGCLIENRRPL